MSQNRAEKIHSVLFLQMNKKMTEFSKKPWKGDML